MLITSDIRTLGDKMLSPEEAVLKAKEENLALAATKKIQNQDELEDKERAAGPRVAWQEVIRRLTVCNPNLRFLDGSTGNIAVYAPKTRKELAEDEPDATRPPFFNDFKYVTGFPKEWIPEYSYITVDERGLPKRELRGWRTILIALISSRVITYRDAVKQFGEAVGQRSHRWHECLKDHKN